MKIDEVTRELIVNKTAITEIKAAAIKQGMETMLIDGIRKVALGLTTMEEVIRVSLE